MARWVHEVMNRELFAVREASHAEDVLDALLEYGITAAPVLDDERRPLGVASIRDLARHRASASLRPVVSTAPTTSIEDAAKLMTKENLHHLVVVDHDGRACGMVSSLDLVRALVGLPPAHPESFPHRDLAFGVTWSDPKPFAADEIATAPEGPGVLVLSVGGVRRTEQDVWVESTPALRTRLGELADSSLAETSSLARVLAMDDLRFRHAIVADLDLRETLATAMRREVDTRPLPEVLPAL